MLSRRDLLLHSSAMTALGLGGSPLALAGAKDSSLKFIFVMAYGMLI